VQGRDAEDIGGIHVSPATDKRDPHRFVPVARGCVQRRRLKFVAGVD
jgi:hypothetical protein